MRKTWFKIFKHENHKLFNMYKMVIKVQQKIIFEFSDLWYCLNFYLRMMPSTDCIRFSKTICKRMPCALILQKASKICFGERSIWTKLSEASIESTMCTGTRVWFSALLSLYQVQYRDRAKERRDKYGMTPIVPGWKKRLDRELAKQAVSPSTPVP